MLWEDEFYEDGKKIADRIYDLCFEVPVDELRKIIMEVSQNHGLRHVPLFMICAALKRKIGDVDILIYDVCTRPDQMTELLSIYWRNGKVPLAAQLKKGLAKSFTRFDEYQLAKYNRDTPIKLRDVLFLCHAKPLNREQELLWKALIDGKLAVPDTWETRLSAGEDKKQSFQELLEAKKMGKLAILRNMRNMWEANVPKELVRERLLENKKRMLPFQFIAAAKFCPHWEDIIDQAMMLVTENYLELQGDTVIFVDVSGSMASPLSNASKLTRMDAACGLAILLKDCCKNATICTFSDMMVHIPPRRGMALRDSIVSSQMHSGTYLGEALQAFSTFRDWNNVYRLIVITDEQIGDRIPHLPVKRLYMLNIGSNERSVKTTKHWNHIDGFSEAVVDYVYELENLVESTD